MEIFPETPIKSIVLIGTPATTHWVDAGIPRRLVLPVPQSGCIISATLPSEPNVLPLGFYMVSAMVDDIPSVAWIRIASMLERERRARDLAGGAGPWHRRSGP